jgi:hypothetical protein
MPAVDEHGQPISDDPDQDDPELAGGKGRGQFVDPERGGPEHSSIETGPNNPREASRGPEARDDASDPGSSNATGGV